MTTKSITTKLGSTITVEIVRKVQDKVNYADGLNVVTGREIIEYTKINIKDATGKTLINGSGLQSLTPRFDAKGIAGGAVAKIGNVYLGQDTYNQIAGLLADVETETPKSDEQIAIETAKTQAEADYDAWYNSPDQIASRKFERDMEREDSDY